MLIIEDGTIVSNANSYVTDAEYVTYAASRGQTIANTGTAREIELILAMDYLYTQSYQGRRTEPDNQDLPFPRQNVCLYGQIVASDTIPKELKTAQMEAAIASNGQDLLVNSANQNVASKKLDVMETSYFEGGSNVKVRLDRVFNYLSCLLKDTSKLVRV